MKVFIATPSRDLSVNASYMQSVMRLLMTDFAEWHVADAAYDGDIARVRSRYVADFLETDCTHMLFIDADLDFHSTVIELLVEHGSQGRDFVSCRYRRKQEAFSEVVGGVGLALLSRRMLEQMTRIYREQLWFTDDDDRQVVGLFMLAFAKPFAADKRRLLSEDYAFRNRWRELGGEVLDVQPHAGLVGHHGIYRFSGGP